MPKHIMLVEDEPLLAANYQEFLTRQGFQVSHYEDRQQAMTAARSHLPDMALIDIGLGEEIEGGFELCRQLRSLSANLPIIFLTARDSEFDIISGLRLGADDYLTKEISPAHISARIVALFRRVDALANPESADDKILVGELAINTDRLTVDWQQQNVELTVTEFWIVHALAKHPGHVKNRQQLMDAANVVLDDNTITAHIKRIRKKFQNIDSSFAAIETVYGMGYRWL